MWFQGARKSTCYEIVRLSRGERGDRGVGACFHGITFVYSFAWDCNLSLANVPRAKILLQSC